MIENTNIDGIAGWAVRLMEALGAPGAGIAVAAENLFPPIPSEVILPLAGFAASRGDISLLGALLWTTAGSVVGATVLYLLGALVGRDRVVAIGSRLPLVRIADVERAEAWFTRHGPRAVFLGRMIPVVRSLISLPAGVSRMPWWIFLVLTTAGSALWNSAFVLAGYTLGENWGVVEGYAGAASKAVVGIAVLVVVIAAGRRLLGRRRQLS